MKKNMKLGLTVLALAALAACGGGGSSPATGPVVVPSPVTAVPVNSNIVVSVGPANYATASEESAAWSLLNAERSFCGFGLLNQNLALDKAAKAHADWQIVNNYLSHYEVATGTVGFTGVSPSDRIVAAGYGPGNSFSSTDETSSNVGINNKLGYGNFGMRNLLNAPYHAAALIKGFRDGGVSVRNDTDSSSTFGARLVLQVNLATKVADGSQTVDSSTVLTYPCEGTVGVNRQLVNETPNPVPGRNLATSPLGSSVQVLIREGNTLAITSATMINVATSASVILRTPITAANDPNATAGGNYLQKNQGFISPDAPLDGNTKYQVTVNGTNNGVAFSRTFSFTTGLGG